MSDVEELVEAINNARHKGDNLLFEILRGQLIAGHKVETTSHPYETEWNVDEEYGVGWDLITGDWMCWKINKEAL